MNRPIWAVIKAIKTRIPQDFEARAGLLNMLADISSSAAYTAPEAMHMRWTQTAACLQTYLGNPEDGWKAEIAGIFADEIDYKQYLEESDLFSIQREGK
jgi:hypothetical protein